MRRWMVWAMAGCLVAVLSPAAYAQEISAEADRAFRKGKGYCYAKKYRPAVKHLTKAVETDPQRADAYYFLGYTYYKQKKHALAREAFAKAYALDPDYSPLQ
ncbi:MAG: tetratricopeptide repeat protein [Nitrospirae bacterium]|nr:tetratricopeptide repeat protein [Nitrospirota bacterium]